MPRIGRSRPLMAMLFGVVALMLVVACGVGGESSSQGKATPASDPTGSSKLDALPLKLDPGANPLSETADALASIQEAMPDAEAMSQALALVAEVLSDPEAMSEALALVEEMMSDPEAISGALALVEEVMPDQEGMSDALALVEEAMSDQDGISGALALVEEVLSDPDGISGALALVEEVLSDPEAMSEALALVEDVMSGPEAMSDALASVKDAMPDSETVSDALALVKDASPVYEPAPALPSKYDAFGFTLNLDQGAEVRTADGSVDTQGALSFAVGDVNAILTWVPKQGSTPLALVSGTYDIIRNNQTGILFESITDGEISASGQLGVFLGFKSSDDSGNSLGGGLIGAWACADAGTAFTLTMTGADASTLQIRFDRILETFTCVA